MIAECLEFYTSSIVVYIALFHALFYKTLDLNIIHRWNCGGAVSSWDYHKYIVHAIYLGPESKATHIDSALLFHLLAASDFGDCPSVDGNHVRKAKEQTKVLLHHIHSWQHVIARLKRVDNYARAGTNIIGICITIKILALCNVNQCSKYKARQLHALIQYSATVTMFTMLCIPVHCAFCQFQHMSLQ